MMVKKLVAGMVAHVDAGKTTLSESMLYLAGAIRTQGRVDHQDTFLDYNVQERQRGITIFSKVSSLIYDDLQLTFIDTPGHVDFSGEMERAISVLDVAILIVSGLDGIQPHTRTIWSLLSYYHVPVIVFVNKMDIAYKTQEELCEALTELSPACFPLTPEHYEDIATCSEDLLEDFLETGQFKAEHLSDAIMNRHYIPCIFGSALKNQGVDELFRTLAYIRQESASQLMAQVYKIDHDDKGERLTFIKMMGGELAVKDEIHGEKINQIRLYQGGRYQLLTKASAGDVVALTGLKNTRIGDTFGDVNHRSSLLSPFMHYHLRLPSDCDVNAMLAYLHRLSQEEPLLKLQAHDVEHISLSLMGEVQIEILRQMIYDDTGVTVAIDEGEVSYRETIMAPVEGVGHFEPLRHYAEVHLLLEPLPQGSGLVFENHCQNHLSENFQRLIMTHLQEAVFPGVLIGAPITDMRISLLGGASHQKHTEGGDFRQATYRAVRHGLMKAQSVILEPYASYQMIIPSTMIGRLFYDMEDYDHPETISDDGERAVIIGRAPYAFLSEYQKLFINYTKGQGKMFLSAGTYDVALHQQDIFEASDYDALSDLDFPTGSVFCRHGAGFYVPYTEVENYMHLDYFYEPKRKQPIVHATQKVDDKELEEIFNRTYGPVKRRLAREINREITPDDSREALVDVKPECLLVDGYNVIFASEELAALARENLGAARDRLIDLLSNYQGFRSCELILVFDAYKVTQNIGKRFPYHNIHIVYTKEAQTADMYIESVTKKMASTYRVVVATSDALEQTIVVGHGATRISARELLLDMATLSRDQQEEFERKNPYHHTTIGEETKEEPT